jgi:hypothetical protein
MGIRIHGGASRGFPQKSLRLYARSALEPGKNTLRHDVFQGAATDVFGEPVVAFNRLLLRNFGNEGTGTMIRDAGLQYLSRDLHVDIQAYRPAVVFLNGEFWGLYNIRERLDERYLASHYHARRQDFAILSMFFGRGAQLDAGSERDLEDFRGLENFFYNNDFYSDEMYLIAQGYMDTDSFIDHYIANIYFGNIDWPGQNVRVWRYNGTPDPDIPGLDGRWRWMLYDLDSTSGFTFGFDYDADTLRRILYLPEEREPFRNEITALPNNTLIFRRLMQNDGFRAQFTSRFLAIMDTYFREEAFLEMVDTFSGRIRHVVPAQIERFGRIADTEQWEENLDGLRHFGINRREPMTGFLRAVEPVA